MYLSVLGFASGMGGNDLWIRSGLGRSHWGRVLGEWEEGRWFDSSEWDGSVG